jgi:2'-5' RNA ligase
VRLFAAVYPPDDELDRLAVALGALPDSLRAVPREHWHLTTAFYGDVPEDRVGALTERLARAAARTPVHELRLVGGGTFPGQAAKARVLWAGVDGGTDTLTRLAERCEAAGRREGLRLDSRRYHPHLTLARARHHSADATAAAAALSFYQGKPWTVSELTLVKSTLGSKVAHETLATLPLKAERPYQA